MMFPRYYCREQLVKMAIPTDVLESVWDLLESINTELQDLVEAFECHFGGVVHIGEAFGRQSLE